MSTPLATLHRSIWGRVAPRFVAVVLSAIATMLLVLLNTGAAYATCSTMSLQQKIAYARHVFIGTVVATTSNGQSSLVAVDRVVAGAAISPLIEVRSPSHGRLGVSYVSEDRTFDSGTTYLFIEYGEPPFVDDACSGTMSYESAVAEHVVEESGVAHGPRVTIERFVGAFSNVVKWMSASSVVVLLALLLALLIRRRNRSNGAAGSSGN